MEKSNSEIDEAYRWAQVFDDRYFPSNLRNRMLADPCYWKTDWQAPEGETTQKTRGMHPIGLRSVFPALHLLYRKISDNSELSAKQFLSNVRKNTHINSDSLKEMIPNSRSSQVKNSNNERPDDHVYEQFNFSKKAPLPSREQKFKMVDDVPLAL